MKIIDASRMRLVHRGAEWDLPTDPSSRDMAKHLVRNERLVTWLKPEGVGGEANMIPAIMVGGRFCALSVRMMKAIWRCPQLPRRAPPCRLCTAFGSLDAHPHIKHALIARCARRDVRLRKGFVNLEPLPQGGFKPR